MNILSLFDGISCGQLALKRAFVPIDRYFASEIKPDSITVTQNNFPDTIQIGDITKIRGKELDKLGKIDLVMGGSPCQDLSYYKRSKFDMKGLLGDKSALFFHYEAILKYVQPKYFLFENVPMEKEWSDFISDCLQCEPITINGNLVSASDRKRLYWTNIPGVEQPNDKNIILADICLPVDQVPEKAWYKHDFTYNGDDKKIQANLHIKGHRHITEVFNLMAKTCTIASDGDGGNRMKKVFQDGRCRKLLPIEYERLMNLPDNYTRGFSDSRRYSMIGNGWTVDIVKHIFEAMAEAEKYDQFIFNQIWTDQEQLLN